MKKITFISITLLIICACSIIGFCEDNPESLLNAGQDHFQKKQYDQAIECYEKYLTLEPKAAAVYNMLGMSYRFKYNQTGIISIKDKEIQAFQKAIDLNPKFWVAMINLGASYYYMGEKAKAAPWFAKAMEINPNNPEKVQIEKMIAEGKKN